MMLVHADAVEAQLRRVFEQVQIIVINLVALGRIEQIGIDVHPNRMILLAKIVGQIRPRHQVEPSKSHETSLSAKGAERTVLRVFLKLRRPSDYHIRHRPISITCFDNAALITLTRMRTFMPIFRYLTALSILAIFIAARGSAQTPPLGEWRYYGGNSHSTKYSPLDQINQDNVKNLKIAWRWRADNFGPRLDGNWEVTPLMARRRFVFHRRHPARCGSGRCGHGRNAVDVSL